MTHEDQTEFYECPLCGSGTGNDIDGTVEHKCEILKELPIQKESEWEKKWNDGVRPCAWDEVADFITAIVSNREKEIADEVKRIDINILDDEYIDAKTFRNKVLQILEH